MKKKKLTYETPLMEIVNVEAMNLICTSGGTQGPNPGETITPPGVNDETDGLLNSDVFSNYDTLNK